MRFFRTSFFVQSFKRPWTFKAYLLEFIVARPRKHNINEVRLAAMTCFWENGYSNTSMTLLQEATGIDKKQLMRDFGSKGSLFVELLGQFFVMLKEQLLHQLESESAGVAEIRSVLSAMASRTAEPDGRFGCMICNTSLDHQAMSDPQISSLVKSFFGYVQKAYSTALFSARRRGEVALEDDEIIRLGRSLLGAQISIMLLLRTGMPAEVIHDILEQALSPVEASSTQ